MAVIIYLTLPVIINAIYLFLLSGAVSYAIFGVSHYSSAYLLISCLIITVIVSLISISGLVTKLLLKIKLAKNPIASQRQRLTGLVNNVIRLTNQNYATNYTVEQFKLKIVSNHELEYFALGQEYIVLSDGALDVLDDNQLEAIIAHCIGGLYMRLGRNVTLVLVNQLIANKLTQLFRLTISLLRLIYKFFSRLNKILAVAVLIIVLIVGLVLSPVLLIVAVGNLIVKLMGIFFSQYVLTASDNFVVSLGLKDELLTTLNMLQATNSVPNSTVLAKYFAMQVSPSLRIAHLDRL